MRSLVVVVVLATLAGCAGLLCPDAEPGDTFCGLCTNPSLCFYCPGAMCPADPCSTVCDGSAAGGGGGSGGGSCLTQNNCAGSAVCISLRTCVVSAMGNGCDCAGNTAGSCHDYAGTAAAGKPCGLDGAPCTGNSPLCCQGNSCNNGRCEGPSGRCPFTLGQ